MKGLYLRACEILRITPNTQLLEGFEDDSYFRDRFILPTNYLGDKGARAILPILKENSSLKFLSLENHGLKSQAAMDIAECFLYHPGIINIDLRKNNIGETGAKELLKLFKHNENIKAIKLEDNPVRWRLMEKFYHIQKERESETRRHHPTAPVQLPPEWMNINIEESGSLAPIFTASPSVKSMSVFDSVRFPNESDYGRNTPFVPSRP